MGVCGGSGCNGGVAAARGCFSRARLGQVPRRAAPAGRPVGAELAPIRVSTGSRRRDDRRLYFISEADPGVQQQRQSAPPDALLWGP